MDKLEVNIKYETGGRTFVAKGTGCDEDEAFHNAKIEMARIVGVSWVPDGEVRVAEIHEL